MSRNFSMHTQSLDRRRALFNRKAAQEILLTLLLMVLAAIPLWLGLEHAHSAPSGVASPPPPAATSSATLTDVPAEALIGEQVKFKVTFKNPGNAIGYGPFIDLVLDAGGANMLKPPGCACDGITFFKAEMINVNGGPIDVTPPPSSQIKTSPCGSVSNTNVVHPFAASGIASVNIPVGAQLVTIALPFGSYNPTPPQIGQPDIVVEVTAIVSNLADYHVPLKILARSGFRYGTDPLDNALVNPFDLPILSDVSSNSTQWAAQAQTTPTVMIIKKEYLGPEDETATGPNFIGFYPLKYKLTVDIATGQIVNNVILNDCLPDNMAFHHLVSIPTGWTVSHLPVIDAAGPPLNCLTVNSPSSPLTGISGPDATVIFEFFIPDVDANGNPIPAANCIPALSKNDIKAEGDWTPLDPCDQTPVHVISDVTPVDHTLSDKCIAIQKNVTLFNDLGASGPTPGDTLRYELNFQVSDFKTIGDFVIKDTLSDGQLLLLAPAPTLTVTDKFAPSGLTGNFILGPAFSRQTSPAVSCQGIMGGTAITFGVSTTMSTLTGAPPRYSAGILTGGLASAPASNVPATGKIVFFAKISDQFFFPHLPGDIFVDKDDPLDNCVTISGRVNTNANPPAMPTPTAVITQDDSKTATAVVTDFNKKTVYAVMHGSTVVCGPTGVACSSLPSPPEVRPGDQVTFRIEKTIPSSDAEQLTIQDFLPLPVFDVNDPDANGAPGPPWVFTNLACSGLPAAGHSCLGPTDMLSAFVNPKPSFFPDPVTNSLKFDYGNFNDTFNNPRKIDLLLTSTVTNKPFADDLFLTNEALECENNTFGVRFCQAAIAQVKLREPKLVIRKGVIATSNPNGLFTHQPIPSTGTLAQAPPGAAFSIGGISGVVSSTDLAAGLVNSDLSNVDANDLLTYAITIENVGGAAAYDVKIEDIIPNTAGTPSCFTIVPGTIKVQRGTGVPVNPLLYQLVFPTATGGFTVTSTPNLPIPVNAYNPTTGQNIVAITFQAKLLANITPGCCDNVAKLLHYSSVLNGPDFVSAGFTAPFEDPAEVCVNPTLTKTLVATSEAHTTGSNVTIGEIARYRLVTLLPEGGSLTNFNVSDVLPAGMKFLNGGTARIAFVSNGPGITRTSFLGPAYSASGNAPPSSPLNAALQIPAVGVISGGSACGSPVNFALGNVKNNDNDNDLEYIVIEFNALVCNVVSNLNGTVLPNTFNVSVGGNQIATSNPINVVIVEPNLTMTKTVAPNPAIKGQTLTYTVQYTNNGTADAFDIVLQDTLPSGLTLGTITAGCPFTSVGNVLTMTCAQVPKAPGSGSTVIVTYQAVANPATCPVTLNNQANLTWTSLPGLQGTTVNPTGSSTPGNSGAVDGERDGVTPLLTLNDYSTTASAAVKIDCPCEATITGLKFNDLNGNGVRDTGEPGLANWTIQVTDSNGITHTTTTDSAGNYSFIVPAPGTYTVAEVLQSGWTQTAPTSGTYSVTVSPGQVITNFNFGNRKKQNKCDLQITKDVKPNPLVSGQQATAYITVVNVGTGPCHGPTQVAESMPAGLALISATVPGGSCVLSTGVCNYAPAIPAGGSVVFTYVFNVTAQPGTNFENCAKLKNSEDQNSTNNGTCVPLTVSGEKLPDLTIQKKVQCGGPAIPQGTCNVTLTIGNNGPGAFNGILVIQDLVTPPPSPALSLTGSSPGWSCGTGPSNNIGCNTNGSVSLAPGQSTTLSLSVKIPGGQYKNCASVKGYTQFPYNSSTLIQEGDLNNNESCVSMDVSGDCPTVPLPLFNTGVADNGSLLASGATDPHYVLLNTSPVSPNAFVLSANQIVGYVANSATSQWLGPDPPGSIGSEAGFYTYRTTFNLACDPSTALISGQWATDNEAQIFLNGSPTGIITGPNDFGAFTPFVITSGFVSGVNTLDFRVRNRNSSQGDRTATGLHVQMNGTVKCCSATGSLTVTKTVENLSPTPIPTGTSFPITVSCLPSGPNVTLNLAAGGTQTVNNIPVGSKCTVTEGPLPAHISSPVCPSLQWSAPTYSPGQSVTIPNSGASQTVTIQNRLVCESTPPVDTYAFTRGMNEFCIWGGGGSLNSPMPIDNPNPLGVINSPFLTGNTGGARFGAIGLCYGRILSANDKVAFKYTFNAIPVAVLSYPDVNPVFIDRGFPVLVSETRRNVFGGGLSPIGLQLYFRPQKRIKPFVNASGGFIFFKDQVPRLNGARFNFTYDVGGGVQVFRDAKRAFTLGYKYQRISNGGRAPNNPAFDGNVFYLGYSIFK